MDFSHKQILSLKKVLEKENTIQLPLLCFSGPSMTPNPLHFFSSSPVSLKDT
jgi:hypothetical protein